MAADVAKMEQVFLEVLEKFEGNARSYNWERSKMYIEDDKALKAQVKIYKDQFEAAKNA